MFHHFFPEEFLALQAELKNHPEILAKLENCSDNAEAYATIGAELGILLYGWYEPKDLAAMLTKKLKERSAIILTVDVMVDNLIPIQLKEGPDAITIERSDLPSQKKE